MSIVFDLHRNFISTTVQTAPSPATTGTSLIVTTGSSTIFPAPPFNCIIYPVGVFPNALNTEIVRVTAVNTGTDTLTIVRGQESSTAVTVVSGNVIAMTVTAKSLTDVESAINTVAAGVPAAVNALNPTQVGNNNSATGTGSIALGNNNYASASGSVSLGANLLTVTANTVEVGVSNTSKLQISASGVNFVTSGSGTFTVNGSPISGSGSSAQLTSTTSITPPANPTNTSAPAIFYQDSLIPTLYVWSVTNQQWVGLITD